MKFAVLEYSSKSGGVWKHTIGRPNYVADPLKEIDPTSFGCYVSALAGEHIPLTGLIVGPVAAVSAGQQLWRKAVKRLRGTWPAYSLEYLLQFDVLLVVHQLSDAHEMAAAVKRLRVLYPHLFIIGVPTQPYGILRPAIEASPEARRAFVAFMNTCHAFLSVVKETTFWYEELTHTPVVYMPQPYPAAWASQQRRPREQKEKSILVAGVTQRPAVKQGHIVARQLQQLFPDYVIKIPKVADLEYDFSELQGARYEVVPFEEWREHLQTLARTTLVINTDYTLTRGRVQTDCAAVGTPSLGGNSDGARDLFPDLASDPATSVEELINRGARVLREPAYYDTIVHNAAEKLKKYDYEESGARLTMLIKSIKAETS